MCYSLEAGAGNSMGIAIMHQSGAMMPIDALTLAIRPAGTLNLLWTAALASVAAVVVAVVVASALHDSGN